MACSESLSPAPRQWTQDGRQVGTWLGRSEETPPSGQRGLTRGARGRGEWTVATEPGPGAEHVLPWAPAAHLGRCP